MKSIIENQLRKFLIMQKIYLKYENEPGVKVKLERVNEEIKRLENCLQLQ